LAAIYVLEKCRLTTQSLSSISKWALLFVLVSGYNVLD